MSESQRLFEVMSDVARQFEWNARRCMACLSDAELNELYLLSHTDSNLGGDVDLETKIIMPVIADEWERRVPPKSAHVRG